ncbi:MAG: TauD/TfdA family dioxygenase [Burkholderiales bacterium]|nr:TauD/TfdA family dioxygenase [Burkholderiales bacterium]
MTGLPMGIVLTQRIIGPAAWTGRGLEGDDSWSHPLSEVAIASLDAALRAVQSRGLVFPDFGAEDFPIDAALAAELARHVYELENGRGFLLLRGLPVARYSDAELDLLYYGLGLHLGLPVRQNPKGELLAVVAAVGDPKDKSTRVYQTNNYLPYHGDLSDVVGLLSVRQAKAGGVSSLVSVAAVYNAMLERHPEYLGLLYRPWWFAHLGEPEPTASPIFSINEGKLSCRYLRQYIELGHELRGAPLSRVELEALDAFDAILLDPSIRLDMMLEPGDIQFANNYAVLHSRTGFEDFDEPQRRRRLLRLWLKMPNARTLAPDFPGRNGFPAPAEAA